MKTTKPSSIPRLEQLPIDQREALIGWLTDDHLTYADAQLRLREEFGVRTSAASLSAFWHSVCVPRTTVNLMREQAAAVRGKVLVEVRIQIVEGNKLSVAIVGGEVGSTVEATAGEGLTTLQVRAAVPCAARPAPSPLNEN